MCERAALTNRPSLDLVCSREPSSFWPPSPKRKSPTPRRLTQMPHSPGLDRSNDGQDHTVLPYARLANCATGFDDVVHVAADLMTRRSLAAPLVGTKPWAHGEQSALPTPLVPERCRVHRKPGSRT